jgi:hypothetical protein
LQQVDLILVRLVWKPDSLMMFDVAALQTYQSFTIFPFVAAKLGPFRSTWAIGKLLKSNWASKPATHSV